MITLIVTIQTKEIYLSILTSNNNLLYENQSNSSFNGVYLTIGSRLIENGGYIKKKDLHKSF